MRRQVLEKRPRPDPKRLQRRARRFPAGSFRRPSAAGRRGPRAKLLAAVLRKFPLKRTMMSPMPLALPAAVKIRSTPTSPSDCRKKCVRGFVVPSRWIVAADTTLRSFDTNRHGQRDVKAIGDAESDKRRGLTDRRLDRVHGRDDVLAAAKQIRVVVGEDGRHLIEIDALQWNRT